jgi:arylsulfatase A-like enzyme
VMFSTDNGVEKMSWPDGGNAPFRGEKGSTWEGGFRVPLLVRWPGVVEPGRVINDIFSHEDWMPTLIAAAGGPIDLVDRVKRGYRAGDTTFKVHLDGHNQMDLLTGAGAGKRHEIVYVTDDGELAGIRYDDWKCMFEYAEGEGPDLWLSGKRFRPAWPKLFNLRSDPFEYGDQSGLYLQWYGERMFAFVPMQQVAGRFLRSMLEYPPSQAPGSLSIEAVQKKVEAKAESLRQRAAA